MNRKNICAAFGCFDGMHRGHRAVLETLAAVCREKEWSSLLLTVPADSPVLTTEDEKAAVAKAYGIDYVESIVGPFGTPEAFVRNVLVKSWGVKGIVLGRALSWSGYSCRELSAAAEAVGIDVYPVDPVCADGEPITTGRLNRLLEQRDFEGYRVLCGEPYQMSGTVVHGKGLGRTVGMPTANLELPPEKRIPGDGVYATLTAWSDKILMGLTNVGRRPSVDDEERITVETNLFGFDRDIYGETVTLEVYRFIRGVMKLGGLQAVREQVEKDKAASLAGLSAILRAKKEQTQ